MSFPTTTHLIIRASSAPVLGSNPTKPWYQVCEVHPKGEPSQHPEDTANHCYTTLEIPREGPSTSEMWTVTFESGRSAHEEVVVVDWARGVEDAGRILEKGVEPLGVRRAYTYDSHYQTTACTYVAAARRYWWDLVEVELEPLKKYGIAAGQDWRREDMAWRVREALDMVRRGKGCLTQGEKEARERWKGRLGVVEGSDGEDEGVMGIE
jgi:hypothetical protein